MSTHQKFIDVSDLSMRYVAEWLVVTRSTLKRELRK
ncbi:hypothetical protein HMPREF1169_03752 [Aeromonas veronii AER397]|nr:hypothetical protein HMPREF1169_03752 [Aeromonas veronii AER397]BBU06841.1 hypothetical protein WP9W18E04_41800 [Aeromonas veronii]